MIYTLINLFFTLSFIIYESAFFSLKIIHYYTENSNSNNNNTQMYLLAYSWTPGYCISTNPYYPGCLHPEENWLSNFTLHGLWPQYVLNGYPQYCTNEVFNESVINDVGKNRMITYWPNVKYELTDSNYDSFWKHEWEKHGTCSKLTQYEYFDNALELIISYGTPKIITDNIGENISKYDVQLSFGGINYVSLQCDNNVLTGSYTCWSEKNNTPYNNIECTTEVLNEDSCNSEYILIPML